MSKDDQEQAPAFAPWWRGFLYSTLTLTVGACVTLVGMRLQPPHVPTLLVGLTVLALGGAWLRATFYRWYGKHVEVTAIRSIKFPRNWTTSPSVKINGGDIDLVLESPDGAIYAVEIKSIENVMVKHAFLGLGKSTLVRSTGQKLPDKPLEQAARNAEQINAIPVLWFPRASGKIAKVQGVIVVFGGRRNLAKAVGAKLGLFW